MEKNGTNDTRTGISAGRGRSAAQAAAGGILPPAPRSMPSGGTAAPGGTAHVGGISRGGEAARRGTGPSG